MIHSTNSKIGYDRHLMALCKAGQLDDALRFMERMVSLKVPLSHYTLTALLNGCCRSRQPHRYRDIWSLLTVDHRVKPNVASSLMAARAASHCGDAEAVHQLIADSKLHCEFGFDPKRMTFHWNQILDALRRIGDADAVMTEYEAMTAPPDPFTISIVMSTMIQNGRYDTFGAMLREIMDSQRLRQCVNHKVAALILDGLIRSEKVNLVQSVWSTLCEPMTFVDAHCFGLALMAAQRAQNEQFVDELVDGVKRRCRGELVTGALWWNHILSAYGRLKRCDKMWSEFEAMKRMKGSEPPDIVTIHILLRFDSRPSSQRRALREMKWSECQWNELRLRHFGEMKAIYRAAIFMKDEPLKRMLSPFMCGEVREEVPVRATFRCNGQMYSFNNLYGEQYDIGGAQQEISHLVADLVQHSGHCLDTRSYPEISGEHAQTLLLHHAEKKALAYLLSAGSAKESVVVHVNYPMCSDCHRFYIAVSRLFRNLQIVCCDKHCQHRFHDGRCSCGVDS